jgi:choline dehydrogenase
VPVVHALDAVGENLRDHAFVSLVAYVKGAMTLNERSRGFRLAGEVVRYLCTRRGLLALQPTLVYVSWHSDEIIKNNDLQLTFTPGGYGETYESGLDTVPSMTCGGWAHRTVSRGSVRASSSDPLAPPIIQPNYLSHEIDQRAAIAVIRLGRKIFAATALGRRNG